MCSTVPSKPKRLLTVAEVAELLQIPEKSIYAQRYRGSEPGTLGIRVGRFIRFRAEAIERWLDSQAEDAAPIRREP